MDVRDGRIVITGILKHEYMEEEKESVVLLKNVDEFSFKIKQQVPTTLYYLDENTTQLNQPIEDAYVFRNFLSSNNADITVRNKGKTMTKSKVELVTLLFQKVKQFTDKFFSDQIHYINFVPIRGIDIVPIISQVYQVEVNRIREIPVCSMLSLDLGTGYYLGMLHEIVGRYEVEKQSFYVKPDGGIATVSMHDANQKMMSSVYFNPDFNITEVPKLIYQGKSIDIIANTSISERRKEDWIEIQHYKKYLYLAPHEDIVIDTKQLCSNIIITEPVSGKRIDLMHIFLIIMTHIRYACSNSSTPISYQNVRLSVPINAEPPQYAFMRAAAQAVFSDCDIDFTTEPEAAFGYLLAESDDQEMFEKVNHIILMDGGDGTFDYIYVKKHRDVWSNKCSHAFNCAGTNIYEMFRKVMTQFFGQIDFECQKTVNKWYGLFKKHTAEQKQGEPLNIEFPANDILKFIGCLKEEVKLPEDQKVFHIIRRKEIVPDDVIRGELEAASTEIQQKKILQTLRLRLTQQKITEICEPINDFVSNFNKFYDTV